MNTICSEKLISVKKNKYIINLPWVIIKKKKWWKGMVKVINFLDLIFKLFLIRKENYQIEVISNWSYREKSSL